MGLGVVWFSLASALLPAAAITPWTAAAGLTLPAVLAARFLVGFGEGALVGVALWGWLCGVHTGVCLRQLAGIVCGAQTVGAIGRRLGTSPLPAMSSVVARTIDTAPLTVLLQVTPVCRGRASGYE